MWGIDEIICGDRARNVPTSGSYFPICRSITGDGVRKTLKMLSDFIAQDGMEFSIHEIPSGTQVFDWTVPKEWAIRDAYIENEQGGHIIDMKASNLHVMSIPYLSINGLRLTN